MPISSPWALRIARCIYKMKIGSRLQVFKGTATRTSGNLRKQDLVRNKAGKIVSKRKQSLAKKQSNLKGFLVGTPAAKPPQKKAPKPPQKQAKPKAKIPDAPRRGRRDRKKPKRLGF